jgi:BirA family transcriptional regulator, biotin operon repressor / biotin---[acetyl-CoA-carboxylase] ligase
MDPIADLRRHEALQHLRHSAWLQACHWLETIDSTNSLARRQIESGSALLPSLWVADEQTAGRGRNHNAWWSPSGCLMLSLAIGPEELPAEPARRPLLSLVAGVAVARAVERWVPPASIQLKWPNDVYLLGRKLSGMLVESLLDPRTAQPAWILGIGLNIAVPWQSAPAAIQSRATCLASTARQAIALESVLIELIEQLQAAVHAWRDGSDAWLEDWNRRSLLTGRLVTLKTPAGELLTGHCDGIDLAGHLQLRDARGQHAIQAAEILNWDPA